jgi:hypothetical protein
MILAEPIQVTQLIAKVFDRLQIPIGFSWAEVVRNGSGMMYWVFCRYKKRSSITLTFSGELAIWGWQRF